MVEAGELVQLGGGWPASAACPGVEHASAPPVLRRGKDFPCRLLDGLQQSSPADCPGCTGPLLQQTVANQGVCRPRYLVQAALALFCQLQQASMQQAPSPTLSRLHWRAVSMMVEQMATARPLSRIDWYEEISSLSSLRPCSAGGRA